MTEGRVGEKGEEGDKWREGRRGLEGRSVSQVGVSLKWACLLRVYLLSGRVS